MPNYNFHCKKCDIDFESQLSFKEFDALKIKRVPCVNCGQKKQVKQVYGDILHSSVKNITTIGQLAEHNSKKIGKTKLEEETAKEKEKWPKENKPWYGRMESKKKREIFGENNAKVRQQKIQRYIEKGL